MRLTPGPTTPRTSPAGERGSAATVRVTHMKGPPAKLVNVVNVVQVAGEERGDLATLDTLPGLWAWHPQREMNQQPRMHREDPTSHQVSSS